jgi:hypothetical protein
MANKTIIEWLNELKEPYRSEAIEESVDWLHKVKKPSLGEALAGSFMWGLSKQGEDYWIEVYDEIRKEDGEYNEN